LYSEIEGYDMFGFPAFCIRLKLFHDRWYGIAAWFSVDQLLQQDALVHQAECGVDKREYLLKTRQFANPVTGNNCSLLIQVYDHMTDIEEVNDLHLDGHWKESVHGRALLVKYFSEVLLRVGDTVTIDFRSFFLDTPCELPLQCTHSGDLTVFLRSTFGEGTTCLIESKIASVNGDVTVVVDANRADSLRVLPGTFREDWTGEIVIGTDALTFANGKVTINQSPVVRKERFYAEGRQICFAFVHMLKTTEHTHSRTVAAAKGRVKKVERRGGR